MESKYMFTCLIVVPDMPWGLARSRFVYRIVSSSKTHLTLLIAFSHVCIVSNSLLLLRIAYDGTKTGTVSWIFIYLWKCQARPLFWWFIQFTQGHWWLVTWDTIDLNRFLIGTHGRLLMLFIDYSAKWLSSDSGRNDFVTNGYTLLL